MVLIESIIIIGAIQCSFIIVVLISV